MARPYSTVPTCQETFLVDVEHYVAKYGEQYRSRILDALEFIGPGSGYEYFTGRDIDEYLDALIPKVKPPSPKLPMFKLADGTLVPATGVTVHGTRIDGTVVAVIVEGVEQPNSPQRIFYHDTINCTVGEWPPKYDPLPPLPVVEETLPELLRQLATQLELQDDCNEIDDAYDIEANIAELEAKIAELKK
jgi:hypothetical protein